MPKAMRECVKCKELNHVRRLNCSKCNNEFTPKAKTETIAKEVKVEKEVKLPLHSTIEPQSGPAPFKDWGGYKIEKIVLIPAGHCPIILKEVDLGDSSGIVNWAKEIRTYGLRKGIYYTNSAIKFFLQEFVDF